MIAIKILELTRPIEAPTEIEDKEAVRFYCTLRGQFIGYVTIWNKHRPIGQTQLVHEISRQLGQTLLRRLFSKRFEGPVEPWWNAQRLIRIQLGLEPAQFEHEVAEEEPELKIPDVMVSICIPTRDRPEDLTRCLTSLNNHKSRVPFEIVVADNNPSSGISEPVVRNFPGVLYVPEPRPGVSYARNAAALHASGDIIVTTDDDVVIMDGWLDNLIAPFSDEEVMAVTGMVLPLEMEHVSQYWFEVYGGLTHSYERIRFDKSFYENTPPDQHVPAYLIGVTANAAFRAEVFADPEIGPFDDVLRVSEDLYMFYRLTKNNRVVIYEPKAVAQHRHRNTMEGLTRQIYSYGRSSIAMQLRTYFRDGDPRGLKCLTGIARFDRDRIREIRRGTRNFPLELVLAETKGHLAGPYNLLKQYWQVRTRLGCYTYEQFAIAQSIRQREKLAQAERMRELAQAVPLKQLGEPSEERHITAFEAEDAMVG